MNIKVYSTPTCQYCKMVKEYLGSKGAAYESIDVSKDKSQVDEMVKVSGQMGVPVVVIGDNVIVGFDKPKIDSLIE